MKKIWLFFLVLLLTLVLAFPLGTLYSRFFNLGSGFGSFIIGESWYDFFDGIPLAFVFSSILLFTAFGGEKKYWWLGVLLIPAAVFEIYFDWEHIYFPVILGLVGWGIGWVIGRLAFKKKV